jgi:hypothetical protein
MGKNKKNTQRVNINEALFEINDKSTENADKEKLGYQPHSSSSSSIKYLQSSQYTTGANHKAQLTAYQEDAAKLADDNQRIEFWLKKANKQREKVLSNLVPLVRHNFLLDARTYLREAIALGSVQAAIQHNELIQLAITKEHYNLLGDNLPLNDPFSATLVCLFPLIFIKFHHQDKLTSDSGIALEEAIRTVFPQNKALQIAVIKALCEGVESRYAPRGIITETVTRNMIASYFINLPVREINNNNNSNNNNNNNNNNNHHFTT